LSRERGRLKKERDQHVIRVKSLLALHGIAGYEPIRRDRRARREADCGIVGSAEPVGTRRRPMSASESLDKLVSNSPGS
jgi:hypothetical protein